LPGPDGGTELDDLKRDPGPPTGFFAFVRDARLFARGTTDLERLAKQRQLVRLAPDELFQAPVPADLAVRLGMLRVTEFLPDGREVTRAVLQAGAVFRTRATATELAATGPEVGSATSPFDLDAMVLMALGEVEIWTLPAGSLPAVTLNAVTAPADRLPAQPRPSTKEET